MKCLKNTLQLLIQHGWLIDGVCDKDLKAAGSIVVDLLFLQERSLFSEEERDLLKYLSCLDKATGGEK